MGLSVRREIKLIDVDETDKISQNNASKTDNISVDSDNKSDTKVVETSHKTAPSEQMVITQKVGIPESETRDEAKARIETGLDIRGSERQEQTKVKRAKNIFGDFIKVLHEAKNTNGSRMFNCDKQEELGLKILKRAGIKDGVNEAMVAEWISGKIPDNALSNFPVDDNGDYIVTKDEVINFFVTLISGNWLDLKETFSLRKDEFSEVECNTGECELFYGSLCDQLIKSLEFKWLEEPATDMPQINEVSVSPTASATSLDNNKGEVALQDETTPLNTDGIVEDVDTSQNEILSKQMRRKFKSIIRRYRIKTFFVTNQVFISRETFGGFVKDIKSKIMTPFEHNKGEMYDKIMKFTTALTNYKACLAVVPKEFDSLIYFDLLEVYHSIKMSYATPVSSAESVSEEPSSIPEKEVRKDVVYWYKEIITLYLDIFGADALGSEYFHSDYDTSNVSQGNKSSKVPKQ
jgi:hypothetical protein